MILTYKHIFTNQSIDQNKKMVYSHIYAKKYIVSYAMYTVLLQFTCSHHILTTLSDLPLLDDMTKFNRVGSFEFSHEILKLWSRGAIQILCVCYQGVAPPKQTRYSIGVLEHVITLFAPKTKKKKFTHDLPLFCSWLPAFPPKKIECQGDTPDLSYDMGPF